MLIRRKVIIKGVAPGGSIRKNIARLAAELKVNGWVRNCHYCSVEACFEGSRSEVDALVILCFVGPGRGVVDEIIVERRSYQGTLRGFRIMTDAESCCTGMAAYKMAV